jgi:putative acetyltransferase
MKIRLENYGDESQIRAVTIAAFKEAAHSDGTESQIVDALRSTGALTLSLVAVLDNEIVGHVAFSPVTIDGESGNWYGLGPISVRPDQQRNSIGRTLIIVGIDRLKLLRATGCVVLGDRSYYGRFGFKSDPKLLYADIPPEYFQRLVFEGSPPTGEVRYHATFGAEGDQD